MPGHERRPPEPGERCASTSNRNFEGRQVRATHHLVSPAMAAAAAIHGHLWTSAVRRSARRLTMTKSITALLALAFVLAGFNTVKGVGQDVQKAGGAIERAAK